MFTQEMRRIQERIQLYTMHYDIVKSDVGIMEAYKETQRSGRLHRCDKLYLSTQLIPRYQRLVIQVTSQVCKPY